MQLRSISSFCYLTHSCGSFYNSQEIIHFGDFLRVVVWAAALEQNAGVVIAFVCLASY